MRNIKFKIKSKLKDYFGFNKTLLTDIRPSSYPFISGDTFRSISDFLIECDEDLRNFSNKEYKNPNINIVFISAGFIAKYKEKNILKSFKYFQISNKILIIHNGDYFPDENFLTELANKFSKIFCVNITKKRGNIHPIPIGLENLHYIKNGVTSNFLKYKNLFLQEKLKKKNVIFSSFNVNTNLSVRTNVSIDILNSRFKLENNFAAHEEYLNKLSGSFFCISPPGNGYDCHRTWEAIYLGVIPVVLKGYLADEFLKFLPILEVENYKDFLSKTDEELLGIYESLIDRRCNEMAFFNYWHNLILN